MNFTLCLVLLGPELIACQPATYHAREIVCNARSRWLGQVALENLAFCCTYGKRNCITNEMYTGEVIFPRAPPPV